MSDLINYQWELDGLVFGVNSKIGHESDADPGSYTWRDQDADSPIGDARQFGVDLIEPGTWNFKLFTDCEDEKGALAELARLRKVWRADATRKTAGAVLPLRYRLADRTRVVYGRPRRCDAPLDNRLGGGLIQITSDFQLASELYFDDAENSMPVRAVAPTTGGFTWPITWPLITQTQLATRANQFTVGGELATPGMFDFTGPSTDAFLELDGGAIRIQLSGSIPVGVTVTVDARPWVMSTYRSDGAGVAGLLSRRTRLPRLLLEPGTHQATYGGYDDSGTSTATVRWRNAYAAV